MKITAPGGNTEASLKILRKIIRENKKILLLKLLNRLGLLNKIGLRKLKIKFKNRKIVIPTSIRIEIGEFLNQEKWMEPFFRRIYERREGIFIDVGINLGQTLIMFRSFNARSSYVGFEPNPYCFSYVNELITTNEFKNCTIFPVGLADQTGIAPLFAQSHVDSSATILRDFREEISSYKYQFKVPVFIGDEIIPSITEEPISVIKIDVEGAELEVLKGLKNVIWKYKPVICCEILPIYSSENTTGRFRLQRQKNIEHFIEELDYRIYRILSEDKYQLKKSIEVHSDLQLTNYVFVHKDNTNFLEGHDD